MVLRAGDGYGCHFEAPGRPYATLCGREVDPADVQREPYGRDGPVTSDHPHATLCFDCHGQRTRRPAGLP